MSYERILHLRRLLIRSPAFLCLDGQHFKATMPVRCNWRSYVAKLRFVLEREARLAIVVNRDQPDLKLPTQ